MTLKLRRRRTAQEARAAKLERCSKRAQALYARMMRGHWYDYRHENMPALRELIDAGLVKGAARAAQIVSAFIPSHVKPMAYEVWPRESAQS